MTRMVVGESRLARVLRDHVFVPSLKSRVVQRLIWEQASQLKVNYRSGPLAARPRPAFVPRPRPGDRVPDMTCQRPDGSPTRLHAELGSRWVLVIPPPTTPQAALATQACIDRTRQRLGADLVTVLAHADVPGPHLLLVRPDAHLGWRGSPATAALSRWLTDVLEQGRAPSRRPRRWTSDHQPVLPAGAAVS